ncbi:phosphoribosylformylglycinamidine synthase I [Longibacter salinarum]|uniref:Phosphoribosylformylglycinamidine synthase subunit PurQ n=1 Tax=Longibacter salinarum TaxID=1850348 RepID=A0A2A8CWJ8_9BACT|nr:phosphoribosylformylglycinamidine synthase subunit PurQ [Longibacter salinarum]PEN13072.1 phosphoribosylformylglycinamidine synthase I [Longibacter salinarum]
MTFGVIVFPGSNCDHDAYHAAKHVFGQEARFIWHQDETVGDVDAVIVPGGFSYGDYLRSGAVARFSPVMQDVVRFANEGGLVLGICNGFQILCEAGLLPGTLMRNDNLRFRCNHATLRVENNQTPFTHLMDKGQVVSFPIAHGEGRYFADGDVLDELRDNDQIVFRYATETGDITKDANPNGSIDNIAGIVNRDGNVLGLMPHPERCVESLLGGGDDGALVFRSLIEHTATVAA